MNITETYKNKNKEQTNEIKNNEIKDINPNKNWKWTNIIEYYKSLFLIIVHLHLICVVIDIHNTISSNVIGIIKVVINILESE